MPSSRYGSFSVEQSNHRPSRRALADQRAAFVDLPVGDIDARAISRGLGDVDLGRFGRADDDRLDPRPRAIGGERRAGIAVGRHGDPLDPELLGHGHRHRQPARLERAGRQPPLVLDQQVARRRCVGSATIGVSVSPRLTGSPSCGSSSRHFHMPGSRAAMLSRVSVRRAASSRSEPAAACPRAAEIVDLAGFIALAGQRAFEMGDVHQQWRVVEMAAFDLERAMLDAEAVVKHRPRALPAGRRSNRLPGATRCAVSAVSVVLSGQTWRSWTVSTPVERGQRGFDLVEVDPARHARRATSTPIP